MSQQIEKFTPYPIRFTPLVMERIWGGTKLNTLLNKDLGRVTKAGESWEISTIENSPSIISNGKYNGISFYDLISKWPQETLGVNSVVRFGVEFPLLVKFLHSQDNLSIQVHPNDDVAQKRHNSLGKTELWYVLDSEPNSKIINGFSQNVTQKEYLNRLNDGSLLSILNDIPVSKGDIYHIPTGIIHALGAGIIVAEIQQRSDITYRIFDYDRVDKNGCKRELHTELAIDVIDYNKTSPLNHKDEAIYNTPFFNVKRVDVVETITYDTTQRNCFTIFICVEGNGEINFNNDYQKITLGETLLIPSSLTHFALKPSCNNFKLLEVSIIPF